MRDIPPAIRADLHSSSSPNAVLAFLTISHRNLVESIRVVSDPLDFSVGGVLYRGCPFEIVLLSDVDESPTTTIRIQNVDRRIGEAIRRISDRATATVEVRSTADFDLTVVPREEIGVSSVIYGFSNFDLVDVTVTSLDVSGTLMLRDFTQEPWPGKRATQSRCPGLFR